MAWDHRVLRWSWQLPSGGEDIRCGDGVGGHDTQSFSTANEYIISGDSAPTPRDFVADMATKLNAAYTALYGGTAISVTLQTDGTLRFASSGSQLVMEFTSGAWTMDAAIFGFADDADITIPAGGSVDSTYQAYGCWYPGDFHQDDTGDFPVRTVAMAMGPSRIPYYVEHSDASDVPYQRRITWEQVVCARVTQWWTDDATAAAVASLAVEDPNAGLDNLLAYVVAGGGPSPGEVYIYTTNDPGTHEQQGPYYLVIPPDLLEQIMSLQLAERRQRLFGFYLDFTLV